MQDVWAGRRELLRDTIAHKIEVLDLSHSQLVREQFEAADAADYETAALACLAAAKAAGGSSDSAASGATAIALLSQMALVFMGLENSGGAASLSTAWGMPRSLNAGDAMFALAQASLLSGRDELTAAKHLQATVILDEGTRALVDALLALGEEDGPATTCQRALLPAAMTLGGLLGGADEKTRDRLSILGHEWSLLPAEDLSRRLAADPSGWLAT
jgi:geranylgeranyl diphosphate synthase type I